MADEVRDVAAGLWIWRLEHPDWHPEAGWEPPVTSTCVESGGEVALLDPIAPPDESEAWRRLDANPPTLVVILKPDHVRDVDLFVHRLRRARLRPVPLLARRQPRDRAGGDRAGDGAPRRARRPVRRSRPQ